VIEMASAADNLSEAMRLLYGTTPSIVKPGEILMLPEETVVANKPTVAVPNSPMNMMPKPGAVVAQQPTTAAQATQQGGIHPAVTRLMDYPGKGSVVQKPDGTVTINVGENPNLINPMPAQQPVGNEAMLQPRLDLFGPTPGEPQADMRLLKQPGSEQMGPQEQPSALSQLASGPGLARLFAGLAQAFSAQEPNSWQNQVGKFGEQLASGRQAQMLAESMKPGGKPLTQFDTFGMSPQEIAAVTEQNQRQQAVDVQKQQLALEQEKQAALLPGQQKLLEANVAGEQANTGLKYAQTVLTKQEADRVKAMTPAELDNLYAKTDEIKTGTPYTTGSKKWAMLQLELARLGQIRYSFSNDGRMTTLKPYELSDAGRFVLLEGLKKTLPKGGWFGWGSPIENESEIRKKIESGDIPSKDIPKIDAYFYFKNYGDRAANTEPGSDRFQRMLSVAQGILPDFGREQTQTPKIDLW